MAKRRSKRLWTEDPRTRPSRRQKAGILAGAAVGGAAGGYGVRRAFLASQRNQARARAAAVLRSWPANVPVNPAFLRVPSNRLGRRLFTGYGAYVGAGLGAALVAQAVRRRNAARAANASRGAATAG